MSVHLLPTGAIRDGAYLAGGLPAAGDLDGALYPA